MVYRHIEDAMRRLGRDAGAARHGFRFAGIRSHDGNAVQGDLIDRANRSNIVINTSMRAGCMLPMCSATSASRRSILPQTSGIRDSFRMAEQFEDGVILGELADGTGGTFFHNRNDLDVGMQRAMAAPDISYRAWIFSAKSEARRELSHAESFARRVNRSSSFRRGMATTRRALQGSGRGRRRKKFRKRFFRRKKFATCRSSCRRNFSRAAIRRRSLRF